MIENSQTERRYRVYFRLVDLSSFFAAIFFLSLLLNGVLGIDIMPSDKPWGGLVAIPTLIGVTVLPIFLILARFMRDEYAETVWKRTATFMTYLAAGGPIVFVALAWAGGLLPRDGIAFEVYRDFYRDFFAGGQGDVILTRAWIFYLATFVCSFQFLRWRDSR